MRKYRTDSFGCAFDQIGQTLCGNRPPSKTAFRPFQQFGKSAAERFFRVDYEDQKDIVSKFGIRINCHADFGGTPCYRTNATEVSNSATTAAIEPRISPMKASGCHAFVGSNEFPLWSKGSFISDGTPLPARPLRRAPSTARRRWAEAATRSRALSPGRFMAD